jgi:hypothetical protein
MSVIESIESGVIPIELREALRTLLSQHDQPYLDIPGSDGPGVCIGTCFADVRRHVEAEYQAKLESRPKVPANYTVNGRRRLPDRRPYQDAGTQTAPWIKHATTQTTLGVETPTAQTESAPEARYRRLRIGGRIRAICSSSSDTDRVATPSSHQPSHPRPSQGTSPMLACFLILKQDQHLPTLRRWHRARVRGRRRSRESWGPSTDPRISSADGSQRSGRRVRVGRDLQSDLQQAPGAGQTSPMRMMRITLTYQASKPRKIRQPPHALLSQPRRFATSLPPTRPRQARPPYRIFPPRPRPNPSSVRSREGTRILRLSDPPRFPWSHHHRRTRRLRVDRMARTL